MRFSTRKIQFSSKEIEGWSRGFSHLLTALNENIMMFSGKYHDVLAKTI
jgi:hypothetical protein